MKTKRRLVSLFLTVCMVLSAIPFAGVTQVYAAENPAIAATLKTADNVLAYAGTDIGDGTYQFKQDKYAALQTARASANALIESADEAAVLAATAAVNTAVTELLGSNKLPDEPLFGYAPQSLMTATADSWHSSNPPQNTVDGNIRTIWHSKYNNGVDERPHILTVDLGRKQLIHSVYVESRTDRPMSGNIRTGRVYAGDTLEAVTSDEQKEGNLVMTFDTGALPNGTPVTLEIPYVYAKVLSVEVDTTNDAHTAIAEFNVNTYDRALSKFAAPYLAAVAFADAAVVGTEYSNYSQESLTAFENRLAEIYATFTNPATKLSDIPTLIPLVEEAQAAFYATMVSYTKADLLALINLATEEANGLAAGAIRAALEGNINSARAVHDNPASVRDEINAAVVNMQGVMETHQEYENAKAELLAFIGTATATADALPTGNYKTALTAAITAARAVYDSPDTGAADMNSAVTSIEDVIELHTNLAAAKAELISFIASSTEIASGLEQGGFKTQLDAAIAAAQVVYDNPDSTLEEIDTAYDNIQGVLDVFEGIADARTNLSALIGSATERAAGLEAGNLKTALTEAITAAQVVFDNTNSVTAEVVNAAIKIQSIIDSLEGLADGNLDLTGTWKLNLGAYDAEMTFTDNARLPGTLDENKKGNPVTNLLRDKLNRYFTYAGPATYQKEVFIPADWNGKRVELKMERTKITRVWVNGTQITAKPIVGGIPGVLPEAGDMMKNLLATPQTYDITDGITADSVNVITIEVDNRFLGSNGNPGGGGDPGGSISRGHMGTEETQTNWNGIIGKFHLSAYNTTFISDLRVYPNEDLKTAKVEVDITNWDNAEQAVAVTVQVAGLEAVTDSVFAMNGGRTSTLTIPAYNMGEDVKLWSEYAPENMYDITASLGDGGSVTEKFGMRDIYTEKDDETGYVHFVLNGDRIWTRGETNNAVFPLTAYFAMDVETWVDLFSTYKEYGVNYVRYHSCCPPEAAFIAADQVGIYLQPEASSWGSGMMGNSVSNRFYTAETFEILREYANHPSFMFFTLGNENGYGNIGNANTLVTRLQAEDPTRLFARDSNGSTGSLIPTVNSDFYTSVDYPAPTGGASGNRLRANGWTNTFVPNTLENYSNSLSYLRSTNGADPNPSPNMAVIGFEVGQGLVYADVLNERDAYTGVLNGKNLQYIYDQAMEKGYTEEKIAQYINASGMNSRALYRVEIEAAMNTPGFSGMTLLGVQDFPGQRMALVGMMNSFGDPKPYDFADPAEWKRVFNDVVPRAQLPKFVFKNSEPLVFDMVLNNFGQGDLTGPMSYKIYNVDDENAVLSQADSAVTEYPQGTWTQAGHYEIPLGGVTEPTEFVLLISHGEYSLDYHVWVYPDNADYELRAENDVYISEYYNQAAQDVLDAGGKVFISPPASGASFPQNDGNPDPFTMFWSSYGAGQELGLWIDEDHPVFNEFPTSYWSSFQWNRMSRSPVMSVRMEGLTNEQGEIIEPMVEVIDSAHHQNRLGTLYEMKVGEGKLVISSIGLNGLKGNWPEAKALRDSILAYMNSDEFNPEDTVDIEKIKPTVRAVELALPETVELTSAQNSEDGNFTVTIGAVGGAEYSFDGENWSDVNAKTDCAPGSVVKGYLRLAARNGYSASPAVYAEVTLTGEATVNKSQLKTIIDEAAALISENYTADTWANMAEAKLAADAVYANADAVQADVDAAAVALRAAIDALVTVGGLLTPETMISAPTELDTSKSNELVYTISYGRATGVNLFEIEADFDPAKLDFVDYAIELPATLNGAELQSEYDAESGSFKLAVGLMGQGLSIPTNDTAPLVKLTFNVRDDAKNGDVVTGTLIKVTAHRPGEGKSEKLDAILLQPSADTLITSFLKYDADGDGQITMSDVSYIIYEYYLAALGDSDWAEAKTFDSNGDNFVDIEDIMHVISLIRRSGI